MNEINIKGKHIIFYDTIKDMPMRNYTAMQVALMQASGIGNDIQSVNKHFNALDTLLSSGKTAEALTERQNLHINIYAALNSIDFSSEAMVYMVQSIDGVDVKLDQKSIRETSDLLRWVPVGRFSEIIEDVKKNCFQS